MTLSQKAILLNTLVFPGVGHFILKQKLKAFIFAGISIVALMVIFVKVIALSYAIVDKINTSLVQGETMSLIGILGKSFSESNTQQMNIAFLVYILIWIVAIVDAYMIGKKLDGS